VEWPVYDTKNDKDRLISSREDFNPSSTQTMEVRRVDYVNFTQNEKEAEECNGEPISQSSTAS
jgi:hypothetical protein